MAGTSATLALPYPTSGDKLSEYPAQAKQLAERIETVLAGPWTTLTSTLSARVEGRSVRFRGNLVATVNAGAQGVATGVTLPAAMRPSAVIIGMASGYSGGHGYPVGVRIGTDGVITLNGGGLTKAVTDVHLSSLTIPLG